MKKFFKIFFLLGLFSFVAEAQNGKIKFQHISLEEGLSQSVVLDIAQDSQGFLYFATQDGLNRYDGYELKVFRHDPTDSNSIGDNWITSLEVKNDTTLWVGTLRAGLFEFNLLDLSFRKINYFSTGDTVNSLKIYDLAKDEKGNLFVGTWGGGLYKINSSDGTVYHYLSESNKNSLCDDRIRVLFYSKQGILWVGTGRGLNSFDPKTEKFSCYRHKRNDQNSLTENFILSIAEDSKGALLVGTRTGLNVRPPSSAKFIRYEYSEGKNNSLCDDVITTIFVDSEDEIWLGTLNAGLCRIIASSVAGKRDYQNLKFVSCKKDASLPSSISANYVRVIFQDGNKVMWIGTWGGGLNKFDSKPPKFYGISKEHGKKAWLSNNFVKCFAEDFHGRIWIGTDGNGIDIWDRKENRFVNIPLFRGANYTEVKTLFRDKFNNIWIGTDHGLFKWNAAKNLFTWVNLASNGKLKNRDFVVYAIAPFGDELLIETAFGLMYVNILTNKSGFVLQSPELKEDVLDYRINNLKTDNKGFIWVGTADRFVSKIKLQREKNGALKIVEAEDYSDLVKEKGISGLERVNHLMVGEGEIFVATSGGLCILEPHGKLKILTTRSGLPNDVVYAVVQDKSHNLWVSTNKGLSKISYRAGKFTFRNYDVSEGLQSNEFNQGAGFIDSKGEVFFGGINGFNYFFPSQVKDNSFVPNVVLTSVKIFNSEIENLQNVIKEKRLQVGYFQNMISFTFAALEFTNPQKNNYAHKLIGFDKEWISEGTSRIVTYTNLDPGEYTLFVKASNNDLVWSEPQKILTLVVVPPFYMTWWFKVLAFVTVVLLIVYFVNLRLRRLLEIERLRTKIASDLHDEVGSLLTQISINAESLNYTKDAEQIKKRSGFIREKSNEVIKMMSDIIWSIDSRHDNLKSLVDRCEYFAESFLKQKGFELKFEREIEDEKKSLKVDFRQNVLRIFKEAINNSVKYSGGSKIFVRFRYVSGEFEMTISDDGKGVDLSNLKRESGIRNMKMRAERIKAEIEFVSQDGFKIKLHKKKL